MITKDGRDVAIEELTPENYLVPAGEEGSYHCVIEVKQFDHKTGEKISRPRIQKFGKKIFETLVRDIMLRQGYEIKILHNPNEWMKEQAAKKAEAQKKAAEAAKKAEKEKFDAAVKAAVAEEIAKLKSKADAPKGDGEEKKSGRPAKEK